MAIECFGTRDIAALRADTARRGGRPSQLGYHGFPAAVCTSVNDIACHGIPSSRQRLVDGDIINIDVTTHLAGFHGDTSATFIIGNATPEAEHVMAVARRCRDVGIGRVRAGVRLGDVGAAIDELARAEGCRIVHRVGGHGIGRLMHTEPHVHHVGRRGYGLRLRRGMALTIEPIGRRVDRNTTSFVGSRIAASSRRITDRWTSGRIVSQPSHRP